MIRLLSILALLLLSCNSIKNQTNTPPPPPIISNIFFTQNQIFYVNKDRQSFGHIERSSGNLKLTFTLETNETLLYFSEHLVVVGDRNITKSYSVFSNKINYVQPITTVNVSQYQAFQRASAGDYILADGQIYLQEFKTRGEGETLLHFNLQTNQLIKQLQVLNGLLLVVSQTNNSLCFAQIDHQNTTSKKCSTKTGQGSPKIRVSGKYIYVSYQNSVQVLDHDFAVIENFQQNYLQLDQGSASLSGWRIFDVEPRKIKDGKVVVHNSPQGNNYLQKVEGQYILKQKDETIANIPEIANEPVGAWLNKKQVAYNKIHGRYQLLLQFASGSIKFYQIRAEQGKNSVVEVKWSK